MGTYGLWRRRIAILARYWRTAVGWLISLQLLDLAAPTIARKLAARRCHRR